MPHRGLLGLRGTAYASAIPSLVPLASAPHGQDGPTIRNRQVLLNSRLRAHIGSPGVLVHANDAFAMRRVFPVHHRAFPQAFTMAFSLSSLAASANLYLGYDPVALVDSTPARPRACTHQVGRYPRPCPAGSIAAPNVLGLMIPGHTIVGVGLPAIMSDFHLTLTAAQWVNTPYAVLLGALLLSAGNPAERVGRQHPFLAGIVVFVAAILLAATASSAGTHITARAVFAVVALSISFALSLRASSANAGLSNNAAESLAEGTPQTAGTMIANLRHQGSHSKLGALTRTVANASTSGFVPATHWARIIAVAFLVLGFVGALRLRRAASQAPLSPLPRWTRVCGVGLAPLGPRTAFLFLACQ